LTFRHFFSESLGHCGEFQCNNRTRARWDGIDPTYTEWPAASQTLQAKPTATQHTPLANGLDKVLAATGNKLAMTDQQRRKGNPIPLHEALDKKHGESLDVTGYDRHII